MRQADLVCEIRVRIFENSKKNRWDSGTVTINLSGRWLLASDDRVCCKCIVYSKENLCKTMSYILSKLARQRQNTTVSLMIASFRVSVVLS